MWWIILNSCTGNPAQLLFMAECIHYNGNILSDRKVISVQEWCNRNILFIKQLMKDNGNFMNYNQFLNRFPGIRTNFLVFLTAVKKFYQKLNFELTNNHKLVDIKVWYYIKKGSRCIQTMLNDNNVVPAAVSDGKICWQT